MSQEPIAAWPMAKRDGITSIARAWAAEGAGNPAPYHRIGPIGRYHASIRSGPYNRHKPTPRSTGGRGKSRLLTPILPHLLRLGGRPRCLPTGRLGRLFRLSNPVIRENPPDRYFPIKPTQPNSRSKTGKANVQRHTTMNITTPWRIAICVLILFSIADKSEAQMLSRRPDRYDVERLDKPGRDAVLKERALIEEVIEPELVLRVDPTRSKIVRTKLPIGRIAISHPDIVDVNEFDTTEIEVIGKKLGEATLTLWFREADGSNTVLRYLVQVVGNSAEEQRQAEKYSEIQDRINELFPNSQVVLVPIQNKLIVRGQAHDAKEARDILTLLGRRYGNRNGNQNGNASAGNYLSSRIGNGAGSGIINQNNNQGSVGNQRNIQIVNMMRVPGEHQVMLKVRVAELSRQASREMGADLHALVGSVLFGNSFDGADNFSAILDTEDVRLFIRAVSSHGYGKILAEPTLVTISGQSARFLAGGEFAVPTTVGVEGVASTSTTFRGFGTELEFTPTVLDKDRIRLQVAPSFSSLNTDATVNGIPGLNTRSVNTTVDLREGQWLAIAGLIQDEQGGQRSGLPYLGTLPYVGRLFGHQNTTRLETELIVLVSPELVHPMESEEVPLQLPGSDVTDPTDDDFFRRQLIQGYAGFEHRSTIWPEVDAQIRGVEKVHPADEISNPVQCQEEFICGPSGLSE